MAVEINGVIQEHQEPNKYEELLFELRGKQKQLIKLQKQVDDLEKIIIRIKPLFTL